MASIFFTHWPSAQWRPECRGRLRCLTDASETSYQESCQRRMRLH